MKIRSLLLFGAAAVLVCLPATVDAQWSDDFDAYADGTLYVMAEIDGRIYSASIAITGN